MNHVLTKVGGDWLIEPSMDYFYGDNERQVSPKKGCDILNGTCPAYTRHKRNSLPKVHICTLSPLSLVTLCVDWYMK